MSPSILFLSLTLSTRKRLGAWLVHTALCVDALRGHAQALHLLPSHNVAVNDLRDILRLNVGVPDSLGINHQIGPMLTLVKTAGCVGSHLRLQVPTLDLVLEALAQVSTPIRVAAATRVTLGARVGTDEDVILECSHEMSSKNIPSDYDILPLEELSIVGYRLSIEKGASQKHLAPNSIVNLPGAKKVGLLLREDQL